MKGKTLDTCGCCEGVEELTPVSLANPPGLSELAYRIGTQSRFKETMLGKIHGKSTLGLRNREDDDPAVALLDAAATMLDVLTFYQERISNEGYMRTATERQSILELARSIGYELSPGVAASTYLAFTLEDVPGSPEKVLIDKGVKVQSLPGPDEKPQIFETVEKIEARPEWNALKLRLSKPQEITTDMKEIWIKGIDHGLQQGETLLIVTETNPTPNPVEISHLERDLVQQRTRLELGDVASSLGLTTFAVGSFSSLGFALDNKTIRDEFSTKSWSERDLEALSWHKGFSKLEIREALRFQQRKAAPVTSRAIYRFRARASLFGYNAPDWNALSKQTRTKYDITHVNDPDWPDTYVQSIKPSGINLNAVNAQLKPGGWVVVNKTTPMKVNTVGERGVSGFTMGGQVTHLELDQAIPQNTIAELRKTSLLVQSEELELTEVPILEPLEGDKLLLDQMITDFEVGQVVALTGKRDDLEGVEGNELCTLKQITHLGGYTELTFEKALAYLYKRDTVRVNANVALATHGETKREVLGSGGAGETFQRFKLKQKPLTYVSASTPSGRESTLELRVNDIRWDEVSSLYDQKPKAEVYTSRLADDSAVTVQFGDGVTGSRLPTGVENVVTTYRVGTGLVGLVKAKQLSLLMTRPLGVKSVLNPLAPTGAEDPESRDEARQNAPLTVLTLDRIVSLEDYQNFARAFAGIGKAQAVELRQGEKHLIHITVAAANGASVEKELYKNLQRAIQRQGDEHQAFVLESYIPLSFNVMADIRIDGRYLPEKVLASVRQRLLETFSFEKRSFAQPVALSEVMAVIQDVQGVASVDVNGLYIAGESATRETRLSAKGAFLDETVKPIKPKAAELLVINPFGIDVREVNP
jgi:Baseplate J-like protein